MHNPPPRNTVGPYHSPLWNVAPKILELKAAGVTFLEIARILREEDGITRAHTTICNWWLRSEQTVEKRLRQAKKPKFKVRPYMASLKQPKELQVIE